MNHRPFARPGLLLAALLAADVAVARAQTAADLFDDQTLQEVRLFINSRDLGDLRAHYRENIHYPADLQWRNIRVRNVSVRSRGVASRSATKPGLTVEFGRYTSGQEFLGLKSLELDNAFTDPALIREHIAMAFFERLGQPAPRESFCRLYINNLYQGLYSIIESVDTKFLTRALGENAGYLFEYKYVMPFYGEYLGDDVAAYRPLFEPRNHELDADSVLYSPIRDLFSEVNQPVDAVWRERVGQYADLAQFVTHVAIETFLSENDGFLGFAGMANFYLYRYAGMNLHRFIVWDKDSTFRQIDSSILQRAEENILFSRALGFADLRALYLDVLERCARSAAEDDWLTREVTRASSLIADAAHEDVWKSGSNEAYDEATEFLKGFARQRPAYVLEEVAKARGVRLP